jgi:hypothetical protein
VDLPDLPKSLDESFAKEEGEHVLNAYAVGPSQAEAIYYGYGVSTEKRFKEKLTASFRAVDTALWDDLLRNERAPLILAGVGYHHPIYRSVSRLSSRADGGGKFRPRYTWAPARQGLAGSALRL